MSKKVVTKKVTKKRTAASPKSRRAFEQIRREHREHNGIGDKIDALAARIVKMLHDKQRSDNVLGSFFHQIACPSYSLEKTVERFWGNYCRLYAFGALERVYQELVKQEHSEDSPLEFNDGDDHLWYVPDPRPNNERHIIVHTSQNLRLIYIWDSDFSEEFSDYAQLHIRRYYDPYVLDTDDKFAVRDAKEAKKGGIPWALRHSSMLSDLSDEVLENPYPNRLSLDHYKQNNYTVKYGDFRDKGYVLSYRNNAVEGAMGTHSLIKIAIDCYIPCMLAALFGCEYHEYLSEYIDTKKEKSK